MANNTLGCIDGPVLEGRWVTGRRQYNDAGSGADQDFTVYKPDLGAGWYWLGQLGVGPNIPSEGQTFKVLVVRPKAGAKNVLSPIASYAKIWNDAGSGKRNSYHIWRPVAEDPVDYAPLGHLFIVDSSNDSLPTAQATNRLMAVHRDYITQANIGAKMWTDQGSSSDSDGSCWQITAPYDGVDCGFWIGYNYYSQPPNTDVFCLKKSAIEFV